jgi:hypothetical protein
VGLASAGAGAPAHPTKLAEEFDAADADGTSRCFVAVGRRGRGWPFLVVTQRHSPAGVGFYPGLLLASEAQRLFIGAGSRLLAFDLSKPARLWEDCAAVGFWSWSEYGGVVLMAAELELAAWDIRGVKLWSRFVEPPSEYRIEGQVIMLDVMGAVSRLDLLSGRPA